MLVDSKIKSYELSLTGPEEVPEWSEKSKVIVDAAVNNYIETETSWSVSAAPELSDEQKSTIDEYIALYEVLALQHLNRPSMQGWVKHRPGFDVTLGPGLSFIHEQSGERVALLSIGEEYNTSGGRAVANAAMMIFLGSMLPTGHSMLHLGMIDLLTGDLTWTNTSFSTSHSLSDEIGARTMVKEVFSALPAPDKHSE